jgi:DNA-binding GntR family transcriptional regulator
MRHHGEQNTCSRARLVAVIDEHQAICDAIAARDPEGAAAAMRLHASMARAQYDRGAPAVELVVARQRKGIRRQPGLPSRIAPKSV